MALGSSCSSCSLLDARLPDPGINQTAAILTYLEIDATDVFGSQGIAVEVQVWYQFVSVSEEYSWNG